MASGNNSIISTIKDFNQKLQNSLLQLRARNPLINQKRFMINQMDRFLRRTANIEINNQEDLDRVKRYVQKAACIRDIAGRIMNIENSKLLRSETDTEKRNIKRKGQSLFDREAELSIRTTVLMDKVKKYENYQSIAANNPKYIGIGNNVPVLEALIKSPKYQAQGRKNGVNVRNGKSQGNAIKPLKY